MSNNNVRFSDIREPDEHGNLITVTATAINGAARLTGQINAKTVREETAFAVTTQERLDSMARQMADTLLRSTAAPMFASSLPRCEMTGRVL